MAEAATTDTLNVLSETEAQERAAQVSDVGYTLALSLAKGADTYDGTLSVRFSLDDPAAGLDACCTPVSVPVPGGGSATLSNVTMAEHRGRLLLGGDFALSGWWASRGTVHLLGSPVLDADTLRLSDLDFSLESSSVLTALAVGAGRGLILDRLQAALRIDMTAYLEEAETVLDAAVAELEVGHGVDLGIEIGDVRLADVRAGDGMLVAVAEVTGAAVVEVGAL